MTSTNQRMTPDSNELATRAERLARALENAGAPTYIIANARNGIYDHFRSTRPGPHGENLISHARTLELWDIVRRAEAGEFDAPGNS